MAFTTAQLDALDAALASGELKVKYDGKEVEYRSVASLQRARGIVKAELESSGILAVAADRGASSIAVFSRD